MCCVEQEAEQLSNQQRRLLLLLLLCAQHINTCMLAGCALAQMHLSSSQLGVQLHHHKRTCQAPWCRGGQL